VPLKAAYKKLRLLVDMGCMFVGHGLNNDFRTISTYSFIPRLSLTHRHHRHSRPSGAGARHC